MRRPRLTFVLQAALPVGLALGLAVALQALVLQQGLLPLQLPQGRLQALAPRHLKPAVKTLGSASPHGAAVTPRDLLIC